MKRIFSSFAIAFFSGSALFAADITGAITFKGTPPAEVALSGMEDNADCIAMHEKTPTTHHYMVGSKGEFANVTVYLTGVDGKSTGAGAPPVIVDQKGCLYTPQLVAIQTGQKLIVKNSDPCPHNVHLISHNKNFTDKNDAQFAGGGDLNYTFDKPELFITAQCDIHPWMFAWISVFDHPYFSISDKDGRFTIKNVPPGKYTIVAEHRKAGKQTLEIEVKDTGATADFAFGTPAAK